MFYRNMIIILIFHIIFKFPTITGMKSYEDVEFIKLASVWKKGQAFPLEDCLFYNFGYDKEFPYVKIDLNFENDIDIVINTHGMKAPSGCSIVLIADKYVKQVDQVMKRVDNIAEQTQFVPLAAFIFDENGTIDVSLRFLKMTVLLK